MSATLVTGAEGYLGGRIVRALQAEGQDVILWVHAADEASLAAKRERLRSRWTSTRDVRIAGGELARDDAFAGVVPGDVGRIIHCAAVTRFNVDAATAQAVNVEGTARALRFARACPRLDSFALVSTIYASGLRAGVIEEELLDGSAPFANEYERSKWQAERLVADSGLPWKVLRVATVIADDESGRVVQRNAVHNTLQLLFHGLISTLPGRPLTPVYLVTGEMAGRAIARLAAAGGQPLVTHIAHRREQSLTLEALVCSCWRSFAEDEGFRRRRLPLPLLMDEEAFATLSSALTTFARGVVADALGSVSPFARQLYVDKTVRNDNLLRGLGRDPAPDAQALVERTVRDLVRTRWGRDGAAC